jgi:CheY-like chemotaxis protein
MLRPRILVVDDLPSKLAYLAGLARSARPNAKVITATSGQQAEEMIDLLGKDGIDGGVIDFDLGSGMHGGDVINALRRKNPLACITLATARRDACFTEEAAPIAMAGGANDALSIYQKDFESRLAGVLTLAA